MNIYYIIYILTVSYCKLLIFRVLSLCLNNCFNAPGKRCRDILHHLHRFDMSFSHTSARLRGFFWRNLLCIAGHICSTIFQVRALSCRIFQYVNTFIRQTFFCCMNTVTWSSVMLTNLHLHSCLLSNCPSATIWRYSSYCHF